MKLKGIQIASKHILRPYGTTQLRCKQPFEYFQSLGFVVSIGRLYRSIPKQQSIIIVHRALLDSYTHKFIQYAKLCGSVVVYSTDDLIFQAIDKHFLNQINNTRLADDFTLHKQAMVCCDVIVVSTDYLKEKAALFHHDVRVIKNALSFDFIRQAEQVYNTKKKHDQVVTFAYLSGSNSHDSDFLVIQGALLRLLNEFNYVRLLVVGKLNISEKFNLFSDQCEFREFLPYQQFPQLFTEIDINLIPLDL
ncbi:MAG: glycosyltransferase family 4 protein, partial [Endozoicomonadaceae bacterium]|nr:glycosyltransferase family 4 protein [Endozoicomonadaceae bacterium]